jgi:phage terminase small subunit
MPEPPKFEENVVGHLTKAQRAARRHAEERLRPSDPGKMQAPAWLSEEAKKIFTFTKRRLLALGLLDSIDKDLVAAYANAVEQLRNSDGKDQRDWVKVMLACANELGLGAPARARLAYKKSLYEKKPEDPMEREMELMRSILEGE